MLLLVLLLLLLLWLLRMEFVEREKLREKAGEKRSLTIRDPSLHTRAACGLWLISSPSQGKMAPDEIELQACCSCQQQWQTGAIMQVVVWAKKWKMERTVED